MNQIGFNRQTHNLLERLTDELATLNTHLETLNNHLDQHGAGDE